MQKSDMERAKALLAAGGYTCVCVRGERVLCSLERGVAPLVKWIDEGIDLTGFSAADKIVGRAAAFLYVRLGVSRLHACVIGRGAKEILAENGIGFSFDEETERIINRKGDGACPMELAVADAADASAALEKIRAQMRALAERNRE